jgi:hypothetical protein
VIRAYGDWLAKVGAMMDEAETSKEKRHNVVLAEVDRPEGFAIAERAIALPDTSVWLVSHDDPLALGRSFRGDYGKRFKMLIERAEGWTRCDHLVSSPGVKPARDADQLPVKVVNLG